MERYNKRWIQILYFILDNNKKASGDSIALSVGVSSRTIRNDMKELNVILRAYDAKIVSEIGHGYILKIKDSDRFQGFLDEIEMAEKLKPFQNIIPSNSEERVWYITSKLLMNSLNYKEYIETFDLAQGSKRSKQLMAGGGVYPNRHKAHSSTIRPVYGRVVSPHIQFYVLYPATTGYQLRLCCCR